MELRDFIKNTLVDIKEGVCNANRELAGEDKSASYTMHASKSHSINFDVAVTVSNEGKGSKNGGGKIKISVVEIGGEIKGEKRQVETNVSRIKFDITPRIELT